jgi:prepilin-type N-terminal cleavage/methylation domain-containing protein
MANARGLSILELLVVLALTSILAGISVLSHQALRPRLNLATAVRQVVMDLHVTRIRAVARNTNHRIVFPQGTASYQLQRRGGSTYDDDGPPVALPSGITVLDCTASNDAISYRPRGNAATFGTVTLQNAKGDVRKVIVDIAGQVRVQ